MQKLADLLSEAGLKTRRQLKIERNALIRRIVTGQATPADRNQLDTVNLQLRG